MGISSIIKYFDKKITANAIVGVLSIILGIILIKIFNNTTNTHQKK